MKLLSALTMVFCVLLLSGCAIIGARQEPPKLAVTSFEIGDADGLSQSFVIGLKLTNPNSASLHIKGLSYSLALNGYELVHGVNGSIPVMTGYGEAKVKLVAETNLFNAVRFLNNFVRNTDNSSLNYELTAKVDVGGLLGRLTVKEAGVVPLDGNVQKAPTKAVR